MGKKTGKKRERVSEHAMLAELASALTSLNKRMNSIEGLLAGVQASGEQTPAFVEKALRTREREQKVLEAEAQRAETLVRAAENDDIRKLNTGEREYGLIRQEFTRDRFTAPKGSLVTTYVDADDERKYRVWNGKHYRTLALAWSENKANVKRIKSIQARVRATVTPSRAENKAHASAILDSIAPADVVTYDAGTKVKRAKNPRTGADVNVVSDGKKPVFVSADVVKDGKLVKPVTVNRAHLTKRVLRRVSRHNAGPNTVVGDTGCTCKPNFPCPAVALLGPYGIVSAKPELNYAGAWYTHDPDKFGPVASKRMYDMAWDAYDIETFVPAVLSGDGTAKLAHAGEPQAHAGEPQAPAKLSKAERKAAKKAAKRARAKEASAS